MSEKTRVALYARFSSDNQRTESIDAQIRAMREYCEKQNWEIVGTYIDEAQSATTDRRVEFQHMIADSDRHIFDIVLVHKLDRFARNRYDSAMYKYRLRSNGVTLCSVLEQLDNSPESIILEAVLEGMAEYYSVNLSREVMKGLKENALHCKHTGGKPPLGYDLDAEQKLVINPQEAEAVRLIYELYLNGYGNKQIAEFLNAEGYRSKIGRQFTADSFLVILQNEKYTGVYVYNKISAKGWHRKRNSHRYKSEEEIIRVENGCPAIITREVFERAQMKRKQNRGISGRFGYRNFYLCSGLVICGCCGKRMMGMRRTGKVSYCLYNCRSHKSQCDNYKEIDRDKLDKFVIKLLRQKLFSLRTMLPRIEKLNRYIKENDLDLPLVSQTEGEAEMVAFFGTPHDNPKFRTLIGRYVKCITVNRDTVVISVDFGFGRIDLPEEFTFSRSLFRTPVQRGITEKHE